MEHYHLCPFTIIAAALRWILSCLIFTLKMEAIYSSEISVEFQRTTHRYNSGYGTVHNHQQKKELHCLSLRANYTDRENTACRCSQHCGSLGHILGFLDRSRYFFFQVAPQLYSRGWVDPVPDPLLLRKCGSGGNRTLASGSVARNSDH
jgi:hypothetical protein